MAFANCTIEDGESISLKDARLRDCLLSPGTQIVLHYGETSRGKGVLKMSKAIEPAPLDPMPSAPPEEAPAPIAHVAVPASAADDLAKLIPANGDAGGWTVIIAVLAVLGGGTAWKFYSQRSKEKHEEKMREMELNAANAGHPPSCKAESEAIRADLKKVTEDVESVSERLWKLEEKTSSLDLSGDAPDYDDRIKKLERALKPPRPKTKSK